jgi:hypothetical protein
MRDLKLLKTLDCESEISKHLIAPVLVTRLHPTTLEKPHH